MTKDRDKPCDCPACCLNRAAVADAMEQEMAREQFFDRTIQWPPPRINAPFTIRLQ